MRILITGASGQLGSYLLRELQARQHRVRGWSAHATAERFGTHVDPVDLTDRDLVTQAFHEAAPETVIHTAALSRVDVCYNDPSLARAVNVGGTQTLVELCQAAGVRLVFISTDLVFDGEGSRYDESAEPNPTSVYGKTKAPAESNVLNMDRNLVIRVSLLFGPPLNGRPSFFAEQVEHLRTATPFQLFEDEWRTPLSLSVAAQAILELAGSEVSGLLHLGGPERVTRLEFGRRVANILNIPTPSCVPSQRADAPATEPRPRDVSLDSSKWRSLFPAASYPGLTDAILEFHDRGVL